MAAGQVAAAAANHAASTTSSTPATSIVQHLGWLSGRPLDRRLLLMIYVLTPLQWVPPYMQWHTQWRQTRGAHIPHTSCSPTLYTSSHTPYSNIAAAGDVDTMRNSNLIVLHDRTTAKNTQPPAGRHRCKKQNISQPLLKQIEDHQAPNPNMTMAPGKCNEWSWET